jgi:hypothetical protein
MDEPVEPTLSDYATGVPLQTTEDHLGRLLGREQEPFDIDDVTRSEERNRAVDEDDEALLAENEVEYAEDDVMDADADDSMVSNNLTPEELSDSTRQRDLLDTENESRSREGHTISQEDE